MKSLMFTFTFIITILCLHTARATCSCEPIAGGTALLCENFQAYPGNYAISNSSKWKKWSGSADDAYVTTGSDKYLKIQRSGNEAPDVVLKLGDRTSGFYRLTWRMYIPYGKEGFYNIQHKESLGNWAHSVYFEYNKSAVLKIENTQKTFTYPQGKWFSVTQIIDLDRDETELWVDGKFIHQWEFSRGNNGNSITPLKKLGAVNFYATNDDLFYIDNICFYHINRGVYCTLQYDPVCVNGRTYGNACAANLDGFTDEEWTRGACTGGGGCTYPTDPSHCDLISVTVEPYHDKWKIIVQNQSDMIVDYWKVNGQVVASGGNNRTFIASNPGTYDICAYFKCGSSVIKCCKEAECTPPAPDCCSEDPLSLPWVQHLISEVCNDICGKEREIYCATYNGQPVIHVTPGVYCPDLPGYIYDCYGNEIDWYGGYPGKTLPGTLHNIRLLWKCTNNPNPSNCCILHEDFEHYSTHLPIGPQSSRWETWDGPEGSSQDGTVYQSSNTGDKMLAIWDDRVQDVVYELGNRNSGKYELSWKMWVSHDRAGYFNIQQDENHRVSGGQLGVIYQNGRAQLKYNGYTIYFDFPHNAWFDVKMIFDFDNRLIKFYFPNSSQSYQFDMDHHFQLGAINFYAVNYAKYYVDDICLRYTHCSTGHKVAEKAAVVESVDLLTSETKASKIDQAAPEVMDELNIQLYPNPVANQLNMTINSADAKMFRVRILDVSGRELSRFEINSNETISKDVSSLEAGMYLIEVTGDELRTVERIVKQ